LPKNAIFSGFFWVSTISRGSNQETLEPLYRTKPSFDDTLMRSIHSGFPWVFPELFQNYRIQPMRRTGRVPL
jgi:hypothetical protein